MAAISHAKKEYMDKILQGEKEVKNTGYSSEFLARMKKLIWRNIFRSKIWVILKKNLTMLTLC